MQSGLGRRKRVTIKLVAEEAGVSTQTVSRVLNNRPDVAPETRKRIKEIIDRLDYHPSAVARSLIQRRSYTLGVVISGLEFIGPSRTLTGIAQKAEEMGYSLLLKELDLTHSEDMELLLQSLLSRQVDGIIWAVPEIGDNRAWLQERMPRIPVPVLFLTMEPNDRIMTVSIDNYIGGRLATEHLLEEGFRHIGHITGPLDWWEARERKRGWKETLEQAGITVGDDHWVEGNWSSASGDRGIRRLLANYPEMNAVFVANDQMALGVINGVYQLGIKVPGDLAIVGFDNIPEAAYFWPPLTTVDQDQNLLGCNAVKELVGMIANSRQDYGDPETKTLIFSPELVIRESSSSDKIGENN